jgi:hypothetical protein
MGLGPKEAAATFEAFTTKRSKNDWESFTRDQKAFQIRQIAYNLVGRGVE